MIILAPFSNRINAKRKQETDLFLNSIKNKYNIIRKQTELPGEYELFLNEYWQKDNMIIIEHDISADESNIKELIECKYNICAFNYYIYPCASSLAIPVLAHRKVLCGGKIDWINDNDDFADLCGFGLIKVNKNIQKQINLTRITQKAVKRQYINYTKYLTNQSAGITADSEISVEFMKINERIHIHKKILKHNHKEN